MAGFEVIPEGQTSQLTLRGKGFDPQTRYTIKLAALGSFSAGVPTFVNETEIRLVIIGAQILEVVDATISVSNSAGASNEVPITILPSPPTPQFIVNTIAGGGTPNGIAATSMSFGEPAPATGASYSFSDAPFGITQSSSNDIYVGGFAAVYRIDSKGIVNTIAGTGVPGFSGDGGRATEARMSTIGGVVADDSQNIFIADTYNNRVRKIDAKSGMISTVAGDGNYDYLGPIFLAGPSSIINPRWLTIDRHNNLYVSEAYRVSKVDLTDGKITSFVSEECN